MTTTSTTPAAAAPTDSPDDETLVRDFLAAMGRADLPALGAMLDDDVTWWLAGDLPISGLFEGKDTVLSGFVGSAAALFEPGTLGFELGHVTAAGGRVVVEYIGTARGAATGQKYRNDYCTVFECRAGKIRGVREYLDTAHVRDVLYVAPA